MHQNLKYVRGTLRSLTSRGIDLFPEEGIESLTDFTIFLSPATLQFLRR